MSDPLQDLAEELREHTGQLAKLAGDLRELSGWAGETGPALDEQRHAVAEHSELLGQVTERLDADLAALVEIRRDVNTVLKEMPRQPKYPPICWPRLTAEQAQDVWRELGEWVGDILVDTWFVDRAHLPDCWALHPGAVESLTWTWRTWLHAMLPTAGVVASAEWHTRWRQAALDGVAAAVLQEAVATRREKCGPGNHLGHPLPGARQAFQAPMGGSQAAEQLAPWEAPAGAAPWSPVPPTPSPQMEIGQDPLRALAERGFWWPHLQAAAATDIAARRAMEARAIDR